VKGSNTFGQRYATQAATNRAAADTASLTVERYFTVTAEGNGESFNIQSDTPSAGNKIVRKIWYKAEAFEATDVDTWTLLHTFADDATYASTATKWQEYLDGQANGTPPFTLALSWEDIPALAGILDGYTADLSGAYAAALLDKDYTGDCIRVRRASDNTEQDIGFDGQDLDTTALTTFCTGTDCFIRTWYDQSGNAYDATNATSAQQPKVYDSSTGVVFENLKPTNQFSGGQALAMPSAVWNKGDFSVFAVARANTTLDCILNMSPDAVNWSVYTLGTTATSNEYGGRLYLNTVDTDQDGGTYTFGTQGLFAVTCTTSSSTIVQSLNGVDATSNVGSNSSVNHMAIGARTTNATTNPLTGNVQAIIIYSADKSTDRAAIESALNGYFNIYP
jgi:hypothetical protein